MCYTLLCNGFGFHRHNIILGRYLLLPLAFYYRSHAFLHPFVSFLFGIKCSLSLAFAFALQATVRCRNVHLFCCCWRCQCLDAVANSYCVVFAVVAFWFISWAHSRLSVVDAGALFLHDARWKRAHVSCKLCQRRCWRRRRTNRTSENTASIIAIPKWNGKKNHWISPSKV